MLSKRRHAQAAWMVGLLIGLTSVRGVMAQTLTSTRFARSRLWRQGSAMWHGKRCHAHRYPGSAEGPRPGFGMALTTVPMFMVVVALVTVA